MLMPPIQATVAANAPVVALLKTGTGPLRFYGFGQARQNVERPYAVWQLIFGEPANYLGRLPDADSWTVQVDVYDEPSPQGAQRSLVVAQALRDAIEPVAYITGWRPQQRDPETQNYRVSFDSDWIRER